MNEYEGERICDHCKSTSVDHLIQTTRKEGKGDELKEKWCLKCIYREGKARSEAEEKSQKI